MIQTIPESNKIPTEPVKTLKERIEDNKKRFDDIERQSAESGQKDSVKYDGEKIDPPLS